MAERREVHLQQGPGAWAPASSGDPIKDILEFAELDRQLAQQPRAAYLPVVSPGVLVTLERLVGAETVFDGETPAAVLAERARR